LRLFESFAMPLLIYGGDVTYLSAGYVKKRNIAWNTVHRRILVWSSGS